MLEKKADPYEKINMVEEVFKRVFADSIHIETKRVKAGGTSNNIYVPKKYANHPVTIIIWDKISDEEEVEENGRANEINTGADVQAECKEEL